MGGAFFCIRLVLSPICNKSMFFEADFAIKLPFVGCMLIHYTKLREKRRGFLRLARVASG
ncbi:MAG: hypothetical protein C0514_06775 [Candidatus Puniceispirillum sp.]|nr:hypothetical protein [Candidatus Puniceispirillum sp.]